METKYAGNLEDYARQIIELSGLNSEDRFSSLKEVIYHLILAAGLHDMLSSREKEVLFPFVKHVQFYFETKISLKERRKNEKKDKFPPHPLLKKDKEKKQEEKTSKKRKRERERQRFFLMISMREKRLLEGNALRLLRCTTFSRLLTSLSIGLRNRRWQRKCAGKPKKRGTRR